MATHDYVIANGTGAAVRSDLNGALAAIVSQNSSATEPSPSYAYQRWADTTAGVMKMRNGANNAWISLYQLDGEWSTIAFENGTAAAPSIYFKDSGTDTGIYSPGADQVGISTGGTARITVDGSGNVNIDSNTLYVDAANNRVGIGTSAPGTLTHLRGTNATTNFTINNPSGLFTLQDTSSSAGAGAKIAFGASYDGTNSLGQAIIGASKEPGTGAGADQYRSSLVFHTSNYASGVRETMRLDPDGRVGIGATPSTVLDVNTSSGGSQLRISNGTYIGYFGIDPAYAGIDYASQSGGHRFRVGASFTEAARIDSSGRLLVGTSSSTNNIRLDQKLALVAVGSNAYAGTQITSYAGATTDGCALIELCRSRGTTDGSLVTAVSGDRLGLIQFRGTDGANFIDAASIECRVDGTPGTNDMPGRLVFSTTADGSASPTEAMRIKSTGIINFSNAPTYADNTAATAGGLAVGDVYKTVLGVLMIRF